MFAQQLATLGKGALLFSADMMRAYRQVPTDPLDYPLMGIEWQGSFYVDCYIPFGIRHGAMACQRISNAIVHFFTHLHNLIGKSYIDDLIFVCLATPEHADLLFDALLDLIL